MILEIYDAFKWTMLLLFGGTLGFALGSALVSVN